MLMGNLPWFGNFYEETFGEGKKGFGCQILKIGMPLPIVHKRSWTNKRF